MERKTTTIFIYCALVLLSLGAFAAEPTSIVFTQYQENYLIHEDNITEVVLTFSTENPLEEELLFPLALKSIKNTTVKTTDKSLHVSLIEIDEQVYIIIKPDPFRINKSNTIILSLILNDFITEDGLFFLKKTARIPLISNYPSNNKDNVFIDAFSAYIKVPENYKLDQYQLVKNNIGYEVYITDDLNNGRTIKVSKEYLNLHSIKQALILVSISFNHIVLLILIIGLLLFYLIYFTNLIKFKEPMQNAAIK